MNAREFLEGVRYADRLIDGKLHQIEWLKNQASRTTVILSDMPRNDSPNPQWMEDIIAKYLVIIQEVRSDIDSLLDLKRAAMEAINAMRNPDERLVLELRYLCNMTWPKIADQLYYSESNLFRLHQKALDNIHIESI